MINGKAGVNVETLAAAKVLNDNAEVIQILDPDGASRNVTHRAQQRGRGTLIQNSGTTPGELLTIKDKDANTIGTLDAGESGVVAGTGTGIVLVTSPTQAAAAGATVSSGAITLNDSIPLNLGTSTSDMAIQSTGSAITMTGTAVTAGGATAATLPLSIATGARTKNDNNAGVPTSGAVTIASGATAQTTAAATGGASGAVSVKSGATDVTVASGTGGASGALTVRTGDTDISAAVAATGGATGAASFGSGAALSTGAGATSGASGAVTLSSGASADANTGSVTIGSGIPAATGTSGNVAISTGAPTGAGTSGNISLTIGTTSGGTTGTIQLAGKVDLTTSGAVTATGNPAINLGTGMLTIGSKLVLGGVQVHTGAGAPSGTLSGALTTAVGLYIRNDATNGATILYGTRDTGTTWLAVTFA